MSFTSAASPVIPVRAWRQTSAGRMRDWSTRFPICRISGITAVELLPVFQFDPQAAPRGRVNYWGYQPVSFFAPHHAYSSRKGALAALDEFREMVKALHRAGIEVILDVVFNHTAEAGTDGPTICYRGLANDFYYILQNDKSRYADYTGCGNTLNANQPIVRRLIQDSLCHWVTEMHVDGFRFDLASILSRDESGRPLPDPPVLWDIESDPLLAGTKLIAEAWDAAGLYQVGSFAATPGRNGMADFETTSGIFSKATTIRSVAWRRGCSAVPTSTAIKSGRPEHSVNFVTCHDGFTLNDLVSYNGKHNETNGENNSDGSNDNVSWNCGQEGPTDNTDIEALRNRQVKNFLAIELLSAGTPMLLMGDEVRRTQRGNNNAYCQDGEISWFDWSRLEQHADIRRFVRELNASRQRRDVVTEKGSLSLNELLRRAHIDWHGVQLNRPDWSEHSHSLAFTFRSLRARYWIHGMFNAYWEPLAFALPPVPSPTPAEWRRYIDTALAAPDDISSWQDSPTVHQSHYLVQPRSVVVLSSVIEPGPS